MNRILILTGIFLTFLISSITSQYATKMYEFPQYGFKIPFYTDAKVKTVNKGTANEFIQYEHLVDKNNTLLYASFRIFTTVGCFRADSLYAVSERYVKQYQEKTDFFRILNLNGNTYPFGWSGFTATAVVDKNNSNSNNIYRDYQAFSNGRVVFDVDIITRNIATTEIGKKQILDEPGFSSILTPHSLEKLSIKLFTKGNVTSAYDNENEKYIFGRCDKLSEHYPFFEIKLSEYDPDAEVDFLLAHLEDLETVSDYDAELYEAKKLTRISGDVYRATILNNETYQNGQKITSRIIIYYFTFNDLSYRISLIVPFVKDDGKVYWHQNNEFTESSVPLFEERLIEILNTIEKI